MHKAAKRGGTKRKKRKNWSKHLHLCKRNLNDSCVQKTDLQEERAPKEIYILVHLHQRATSPTNKKKRDVAVLIRRHAGIAHRNARTTIYCAVCKKGRMNCYYTDWHASIEINK
mmetsp:Transcript_9164/g.17146  ORF Transcript_9164/g.17146 Transcript_9164/m.17146 type:complete len:114 (-) Transcript_9164:78-419(-)